MGRCVVVAQSDVLDGAEHTWHVLQTEVDATDGPVSSALDRRGGCCADAQERDASGHSQAPAWMSSARTFYQKCTPFFLLS